ncbi:uncharacterized protein N7498_007832 [Penicillium cinerascens]|uniref:SGNH hydrolase-type esterase domain-containing protein n=1 Tax=Penicillium cinerascens TaxID=70096 RepID=A0A9W9MDQ9_9EURO|nr:uncharacterized protein N7498_007832 [Penicillium cinerascens]KAJ5198715.1 hypothetical protein N7498_007832 [Penicillium cinerascens]
MDQNRHWVHTWTAMPMPTEPDNLPPKKFVILIKVSKTRNTTIFPNTTIRQTVKITLGTENFFRLRLSNAFGTDYLTLSQITMALAHDNISGSSRIKANTLRNVTFDDGLETTNIVCGAQAVSDPISFGFPLSPNTVLCISIFLKDGQDSQTGITSHPGSRTSSFCSLGNCASETDLIDPSVQEIEHWFYISGIEVLVPREWGAFAIIGDSITDGRCSTTNGNDRWPDLLFSRLQSNPVTAFISILNQAAGGNRILADGLGPNLLSRLDRDVLSLSGVKYVLIFEGVNDIGTAEANEESQKVIGDRMIAGYKQVVTRVHAHGISIFAATITPFERRKGEVVADAEAEGLSRYSHPIRARTRQRVNKWIHESGVFDAVIDFNEVLEDNDENGLLKREFDSGDRLHPNTQAFKEMADFFPLDVFERVLFF